MKNIILFGQMGAGKSTIAQILKDYYNYKILSLGSKIHSECHLYNAHDREHLQKYGQSMREIFGKNIWCEMVKNQMTEQQQDGQPVVIDDGRQLNEFDFFTNENFITIGIVADKQQRVEHLKTRINYEFDLKTLKHDTEIQANLCVNKSQVIIINNYILTDLIGIIGALIKDIKNNKLDLNKYICYDSKKIIVAERPIKIEKESEYE